MICRFQPLIFQGVDSSVNKKSMRIKTVYINTSYIIIHLKIHITLSWLFLDGIQLVEVSEESILKVNWNNCQESSFTTSGPFHCVQFDC